MFDGSGADPGDREGPAQLNEEGLQCERGVDVELGEIAPGLAGELGRLLGAGEPFHRGVLAQLVNVIAMDGGLRPGREGDQVAVPRRELLQRRQQLLPLGSARGPAEPLFGLSLGQLEPVEAGLGCLPGTCSAAADAANSGAR